MLTSKIQGNRRVVLWWRGDVPHIVARHRVSEDRLFGRWLLDLDRAAKDGAISMPAFVVAWTLRDTYNAETGESRATLDLLCELAEYRRELAYEKIWGGAETTPSHTATEYHWGLRELEKHGAIKITRRRGQRNDGLRGTNSYRILLPSAAEIDEAKSQQPS